ncbi:MAG: hypothetical protein Q8R18_04050 [bacterium]|nr:hypothetical protein [bacterium]
MPTHFILDRKQQEAEQTIQEILDLTKKRPYPTKETIHLARFVDACFYVIEDVKKKEFQKKEEEKNKKEILQAEKQRKLLDEQRKKELEALAPTPETNELPLLEVPELPLLEDFNFDKVPAPGLAKREYVLQLYQNPIGVLVEKEQDGSYQYHIIEPYIEKKLIEKAKEIYGRDFERDNSLFDNQAFLKKVAEKVTNKLAMQYTELLPQQIQYYLERDILGAGPFDPLLYDEKIKTIICEGPDRAIKVDYTDFGSMNTNVTISNEGLNRFLKRLAIAAGKTINEQNPILEIDFQGLRFEGIMGIGGGNSRVTIRRLE